MLFYLFSTIIPLTIIAIYLWRFKPKVLQGLWESIPPLLGYILTVYLLEKEQILSLGWVFYTITLFGLAYFIIVIAAKCIQWVLMDKKIRKPIFTKPFKIGLGIVLSLMVLVFTFYLSLGIFVGKSAVEAAKAIVEVRQKWKEQKNSLNRLEQIKKTPYRSIAIPDSTQNELDSITNVVVKECATIGENEVKLFYKNRSSSFSKFSIESQKIDSIKKVSFKLWEEEDIVFTAVAYSTFMRDTQDAYEFEVYAIEIEYCDLTGTYHILVNPNDPEKYETNYVDRN